LQAQPEGLSDHPAMQVGKIGWEGPLVVAVSVPAVVVALVPAAVVALAPVVALCSVCCGCVQ
jgi:hypothetical protein